MKPVPASTDPSSTDPSYALAAEIADRRAKGLDRYDEVWDGVYRIVAWPALDHQELVTELMALFRSPAKKRNLKVVPGTNIGVNDVNFRVPDVGVYRPGTPHTSRAFLATAELVVELLSRPDEAGAKLDFYGHWKVNEYLEIDLRRASALLLRRTGDRWDEVDTSAVLGFAVEDKALWIGDERLDIATVVADAG